MRVIHIVEATIAGVRTHVQALATGLKQRGFESVVACPPRRQQAYGDEQFVARLAEAGIPVLPVAMQRSISVPADAAALRRLIAILRRERFDVVHLHSSKAGFLGRLAARAAGTNAAVLYTPNGLSFLGRQRPAKRQLYLALERLAGPLCDRIIAVSASERDTIVASRLAPAERVASIPMGVAAPALPAGFDRAALRAQLGVPAGAQLIGTLARATAQKNPQLFVAAAAEVLRRHPRAFCIWCGDGELRAEAQAAAQARGIAERCRFIGHREDALQVLACFDQFWLTSDYESFGLATVEAMALGVPVIATRVLGSCDIVADGTSGLLVPPDQPAALARASCELLADPARAQMLARAGQARMRARYTLGQMLDATAALYHEVVAERRGQAPESLPTLAEQSVGERAT